MVSSPSTTSPRRHCHRIVYHIIMKSLSTCYKTTQGIHTIHDITTTSLSSHRPPHEIMKSLSTYFKTTQGIHTIHDITMRCHHTFHHHHAPSTITMKVLSISSFKTTTVGVLFTRSKHNTLELFDNPNLTCPASDRSLRSSGSKGHSRCFFPSLSSHTSFASPGNSQPPLRLGAIIVITILFTHCLKVYYCDSNGNFFFFKFKNPQKQRQKTLTSIPPSSQQIYPHHEPRNNQVRGRGDTASLVVRSCKTLHVTIQTFLSRVVGSKVEMFTRS